MDDVDSEQFSLRWNNFHSNLSSGFHSLLEEEGLVDVTLAAEGKFVQAHKLVLSVCSPYFKELFKINPCKHPIVILKDVCHKELNDILQFMYRGEVNVKQEELTSFLKTAEMLQVKGLTGDDEACEQEELSPAPLVTSPPVANSLQRKPPPKVHSAQEPIEKKPRIDMPVELSNSGPSTPPFKRLRPEPAPSSSMSMSVKSSSSPLPITSPSQAPIRSVTPKVKRDEPAVTFVEVARPKEEPIELDSDNDESDSNISIRDDSLMNLLGGESSYSQQDMSGLGIVGNFSNPNQEGMPQEAGQDIPRFITGTKGSPQLIFRDYLYTRHSQYGTKISWRCVDYPTLKCCARCMTDTNKFLLSHTKHNHGSHAKKIEKRISRMRFESNVTAAVDPLVYGPV